MLAFSCRPETVQSVQLPEILTASKEYSGWRNWFGSKLGWSERKKKERANRSLRHCIASRCILFLSLVRRASADIVMMNESVSGRTCAGECASAETRQKRKDSSLLLQQTTASFLPVVCCILMAHSSAGSIARAFSFRSSFLFTLFGIHFHRPFFFVVFFLHLHYDVYMGVSTDLDPPVCWFCSERLSAAFYSKSSLVAELQQLLYTQRLIHICLFLPLLLLLRVIYVAGFRLPTGRVWQFNFPDKQKQKNDATNTHTRCSHRHNNGIYHSGNKALQESGCAKECEGRRGFPDAIRPVPTATKNFGSRHSPQNSSS